jgi:hypothetical protein
MKIRIPTVVQSLLFGIAATAVLTTLAYVSIERGNDWVQRIGRILSWSNTLLQSMVPPVNIGTEAKPVYEGTPLNYAAYVLSYPLSIAVYTFVAYLLIRSSRSRHASSSKGAAK